MAGSDPEQRHRISSATPGSSTRLDAGGLRVRRGTGRQAGSQCSRCEPTGFGRVRLGSRRSPTGRTSRLIDFAQAVVHLQKSRAATWHALGEAWARLEPGGRLLLVGGNDLGVKSAVKRLSGELDQPAEILPTGLAHGSRAGADRADPPDYPWSHRSR